MMRGAMLGVLTQPSILRCWAPCVRCLRVRSPNLNQACLALAPSITLHAASLQDAWLERR